MGTQAQFRGGGYWGGDVTSNITIDPRLGAVQVFSVLFANRAGVLVDARLLVPGADICRIYNFGTNTLTVTDAFGASLGALGPNTVGSLSLFDASTVPGVWKMRIGAAGQLVAPPPTNTLWSFGGINGGFTAFANDVLEYNQQTGSWALYADEFVAVPERRLLNCATAKVGAVAILSGGGDPNTADSFLDTYRYTSNPRLGISRADSTFDHSGSSAATLDGHYHHYGGFATAPHTNAGYDEVWKYDDGGAGTWTLMMPFTVSSRIYHTLVATNLSDAYVYSGRQDIAFAVGRSMTKLTPSTNTSIARTDGLLQRELCCGALLESRLVYPLGHFNGNIYSNTVQEYTTATDSWRERTPLAALTGGRGTACAVTNYLGNKMHVWGGRGNSSADADRLFEMTPGAVIDTWVEKERLPLLAGQIDQGGLALAPSP